MKIKKYPTKKSIILYLERSIRKFGDVDGSKQKKIDKLRN